jgi:hypothetical protein
MTENELETRVASSSLFDVESDGSDPGSDSEESQSANHSWVGLNPEFSEFRKLGAPQHVCSFGDFENVHQDNPIFVLFRKRLSKFLHEFLPLHNIPLPELHDRQRKWSLRTTDKVCVIQLFNNQLYLLICGNTTDLKSIIAYRVALSPNQIYLFSRLGIEDRPSSM